jgi:exosome complex component RRP4
VKARYVGEIGDLVVSRITAVESKRWKTDIRTHKEAVLMLSSVNLPGGVQRMRTYEDQLQMRELYRENDLVSAEVQNISADGMVSLHTRSLKYGKLENGQLVEVPAVLVPRLPQHYIVLPCGVDLILGRNGMIWITRSIPEEWRVDEEYENDSAPRVETLQRLRERHRETPLLRDERLMIARVYNTIITLANSNIVLNPDIIWSIVSKSIEDGIAPKDIKYTKLS